MLGEHFRTLWFSGSIIPLNLLRILNCHTGKGIRRFVGFYAYCRYFICLFYGIKWRRPVIKQYLIVLTPRQMKIPTASAVKWHTNANEVTAICANTGKATYTFTSVIIASISGFSYVFVQCYTTTPKTQWRSGAVLQTLFSKLWYSWKGEWGHNLNCPFWSASGTICAILVEGIMCVNNYKRASGSGDVIYKKR